MLDSIGQSGQEKLGQSIITIIGAGGLGSAAAFYLAAAGIGVLRIVDCDVVDITNLNRQILHGGKDVTRRKVDSAVEKLRALNAEITVEGIHERLTASNVDALIQGSHLVLDCLDNFPTRYILNEAARRLNIPFIHGACRGFEGRVATIIPGVTPCLRCIIPCPPPPEKFPILGTTAGAIGLLQANEALKFLLKIGIGLSNSLLLYDGERNVFRVIDVEKDPDCQTCGKGATA